MSQLSDEEQDQIVAELTTSFETMPEEEFEAKYEELDADHQLEVDESAREFANNAVGSDNWDQ